MAEIIVGRLKFQLPGLFGQIRQHIDHRAQLGFAVAVQIHRSAIPGTHHWPCLLDVGHETVIRAQQRAEIGRNVLSQLPVQPMERIYTMQLIEAGMAQQIAVRLLRSLNSGC